MRRKLKFERGLVMLKKLIMLTVVLGMVFTFNACVKKEEKIKPSPVAPQAPGMMPPGQPMPAPGSQTMPAPGIVVPKGEGRIVVPDSVKGKWKAVKIVVEDKTAKSSKEYTIKLGSEFAVPNSKLKIHIGDFLPDFRMEGEVKTSVSNQPNNPAVNIKVYEDGKEIWKGWLYSKFPAIHPFQHERYGLGLKEGVSTT